MSKLGSGLILSKAGIAAKRLASKCATAKAPGGHEMMVCLRRIASLPDGFDALRADTEADGDRQLRRLAAELETRHACIAD